MIGVDLGRRADLRRAAGRPRVGVRRRDVHRRRAARRARGAIREQRLAARFAAKEAFVKAWSGARRGLPPLLAAVDLREIEVVDDGHGRPALRLHGAVAAAVGERGTHLSLSHDGPSAIAVVILDPA